MIDSFSFLSPEQLRFVEEYEVWAFGRSLDDAARELLVTAPAIYAAPGLLTGRFPGCERHNDYIEKWPRYRDTLKVTCLKGNDGAGQTRLLGWMDQVISDQRWENHKAAEEAFWSEYRKRAAGPTYRWAGLVLIILAAIVAIPLHIIGFAICVVVGLIWVVVWLLKKR